MLCLCRLQFIVKEEVTFIGVTSCSAYADSSSYSVKRQHLLMLYHALPMRTRVHLVLSSSLLAIVADYFQAHAEFVLAQLCQPHLMTHYKQQQTATCTAYTVTAQSHCTSKLFADDLKLYSVAHTCEDNALIIQKSFKKLYQ